jgi:pyruvate,water dikinase
MTAAVGRRVATPPAPGFGYVAATESCLPGQLREVGGKAVGLGALLRAGQRVAPSFVVTAAAYREYLASAPRAMTPAVRDAVTRAYAELCERHGGELTVAVRSSATIEDSSDSSCAGQFRTFLGASGVAEVLDQVEQCWAAASDPRVSAYRDGRGLDSADDGVAVVVQELVDASAAGVMFTQHPRTGDRSLVVIESSYGLGEAVVGGEVTPDLFEVNKIVRSVHHSRAGTKSVEHRLAPDRRSVRTLPVGQDRRQAWSITGEQVTELVAIAGELEARLGRGLDVEWALGTTASTAGAQALFLLQVRPITAGGGRAPGGPANASAVDHILGRLSGRTRTGPGEP